MSVSFKKCGDVQTFTFDLPGLEKLVIDYSDIPREQRTGLAKALLQAAVLSCYTAALDAALEARGGVFEGIRAETELGFGKNEAGEGRVRSMNLNVTVDGLDKNSAECFERCAKIMRRGCLVSASLEDGLHMSYNLKAEYKD